MHSIKCIVCRQQLPTLKNLKSHCLKRHSKPELVKAILKSVGVKNKQISIKTCTKDEEETLFKSKRIKKELIESDEVSHQANDKLASNIPLNKNEENGVEEEQVEIISVNDNGIEIKKNCIERSPVVDKSDSPLNLKCDNESADLLVQNTSNIPKKTEALETTPCVSIKEQSNNFYVEDYEQNIIKISDENGNITYSNVPDKIRSCSKCFKESLAVGVSFPDAENKCISGIQQLKVPLRKIKTFKREKSKNVPHSSLDDKSGFFYICHCMEQETVFSYESLREKLNLKLSNLDSADSCSDAGKQQLISSAECLFFCSICGEAYPSKIKLLQHVQIHNLKCNICGGVFLFEDDYKTHLQSHLIKIFACHFCKKEFGHKQTLLQHLEAHLENEVLENILSLEDDYPLSSYNRFMYENYNPNMNNYYYYERPENIHKYNFCCEVCRITFYNFYDYQLHWRIHFAY